MRALMVFLCVALPARAAVVVVLPVADDVGLASELRAALSSVAGFTVQPAAVTAESIAAAKALGLACALPTPSCMAELGGLANGDLVVGGSLAPVSGGARIALRLIEVASMKERRAATLVVPDGAGRTRALRLLAIRLAAPERERGSLTVRVRPHGATIVVDGVARGTAPLSAPIVLMAGRHDVYVARPGHVSANESVDVDFDEAAVLDIELPREEHAAASGDGERVPPPAADDRSRVGSIAITAVDVTGAGVDVARKVAVALAMELEKLADTSVLRLEEVPGVVEERCHDAGCNQLVASMLGVETLVQAEVNVDGDNSHMVVRRLDGASGELLTQESRVMKRRDGAELLEAIGPTVQLLFVDRHLRAGAVRSATIVVADGRGLPPWVFFSSLAATSAAAGTAVGLFAFSQFDADDATKNALQLPMWIAIGTSATLAAVDVAVAVATEW